MSMSNNYIERCPDNHHCENGSQCVQNPYDNGSYYCDCNEVIWDVRYEGLRCEHKVEIYCTGPNDRGLDEWFCLNGGICHMNSDTEDKQQWACKCKEEYEGSFCQFVKGSKPKGYPFNQQQKHSYGGSFAAGMIGSLVTLLVIGAVAVVIFYRRREETERFIENFTRKDMKRSEEDGALMKDSVAKSMRQANIEAFGKMNKLEGNIVTPSGDEIINNESRIIKVIEQPRPSTQQSEAGISYAEEVDFKNDDNSMLSFT